MIFVAGLAVNRTGLKLTDLGNFLTDKNLSHAFRGGIEYVGYHGLNATSMHSFWARYLKMDLEIQNNQIEDDNNNNDNYNKNDMEVAKSCVNCCAIYTQEEKEEEEKMQSLESKSDSFASKLSLFSSTEGEQG